MAGGTRPYTDEVFLFFLSRVILVLHIGHGVKQSGVSGLNGPGFGCPRRFHAKRGWPRRKTQPAPLGRHVGFFY